MPPSRSRRRPKRSRRSRPRPPALAPVPPPAPVVAEPDPVTTTDLERIARLHQRRARAAARALVERDQVVADLRRSGVSWSALASAAGTTRQALMQRHVRWCPVCTADVHPEVSTLLDGTLVTLWECTGCDWTGSAVDAARRGAGARTEDP